MKLLFTNTVTNNFSLCGFTDVYDMLCHIVRIYHEKEPYRGEFMPLQCLVAINGKVLSFIRNGFLHDDYHTVLRALEQLPKVHRKFCNLREVYVDDFERKLSIVI